MPHEPCHLFCLTTLIAFGDNFLQYKCGFEHLEFNPWLQSAHVGLQSKLLFILYFSLESGQLIADGRAATSRVGCVAL